MSSPARASRFAAALGRAGSTLQGSGVNLAVLHEDALHALQLAGRLQDYRQYLAQARAFKAESPHGAEIDAEVLVHGRQALADAHGFTSASLRIVRSLHRGGVLSRQVAVWRSAIQEAGTVSILGEWAGVSGLPEVQAGFDEIGVSPGILASIDEAIRQTNAEVTLDPQHLVLKATVDGARVTGMVNTAAPPAMPANVVDLLVHGRFERMVDALERGEPAFLEGVGIADLQQVGFPEVALHDALETYREVVRHVRKLEDTGLATSRGGGPALIILGIALAVLIIGFVISAKYCHDPQGPPPEHPDADKLMCWAGTILVFIAFVLMGIAAKKVDPPPPSLLTMGGPVMHGVLRDLTKTAI